MFLYVKALHIIFIVTWFSGLFYIVRLFIYFSEASLKEDPEKVILQNQLLIMQRRLWYGITWPSAILTLIFGGWLLYLYNSIPTWLIVKLIFVAGLYVYHFYCHYIFKQQQKRISTFTSNQLRILNEGATVFLFAIIFLVILKNSISFLYGLLGLAAFAGILLLAIKIYRNFNKE